MDVLHEPEKQRFSIQHSTGALAVLEYRRDNETINATHTFVPEELRGQGIAKKLTNAFLNYSTSSQLIAEADCSYVARFLKA